jgi:hypothetical protein
LLLDDPPSLSENGRPCYARSRYRQLNPLQVEVFDGVVARDLRVACGRGVRGLFK